MARLFVRHTAISTGSSASDANDGFDPTGANLSGASYDDTGHGDGDFRVSAASGTPFANSQAGDPLYLSGGAGITVGLYYIDTVVSSTVVTLTTSAGSDSTADVTSSNGPKLNPWNYDNANGNGPDNATIICADATWSITTQLSGTTTGAAKDLRCVWGANSRGVVDGTQAVLDGTSLTVNMITQSADYRSWRHFHVINHRYAAASAAVIYDGSRDYNEYVNIKCSHCGWGIYLDGDHSYVAFCEFTDLNNTFSGDIGHTKSGFGCVWFGCKWYDLTDSVQAHWNTAGWSFYVGCEWSNTAENGVNSVFGTADDNNYFIGCTFKDCGATTSYHGINCTTAGGNVYLYGCVFDGCGGYGVNSSSSVAVNAKGCLFFNNGSGDINGHTEEDDFDGWFLGENKLINPGLFDDTELFPNLGSPMRRFVKNAITQPLSVENRDKGLIHNAGSSMLCNELSMAAQRNWHLADRNRRITEKVTEYRRQGPNEAITSNRG